VIGERSVRVDAVGNGLCQDAAMRDLARRLSEHRRKRAFYEPHARRRNQWRTKWEFMRRDCYCMWPMYGPVLPPLREGRFQVGRHTSFYPGVWISVPGDARLEIGHHCTVSFGATIHSYGSITIGNYTGIGIGTFMSDATHVIDDPEIPISDQGMTPSEPIVIGDHVWIGVRSIILPGVTIGDHAIVSVHSVVNRDVEPYTVVAGSPARLVRRIEKTAVRPVAAT
jgi:acetyltransferase-like isoleucine patch superfamily enzyme